MASSLHNMLIYYLKVRGLEKMLSKFMART